MTIGERKECEKPLKTFTKLSWECRELNYWQRLKHFKLLSNEQRMERYRVFYIWKSLNGYVPSLGLEWTNNVGRLGPTIKYPKIVGPEGRVRTLHKNSICWEGVRIFNSLPASLRTWNGTKEKFKIMLDKYLELLPDQPETDDLKPGGLTINRERSNSIADWARALNVDFESLIVIIPMDSHDDDSVLNNSTIIVNGERFNHLHGTCV